MQGDPPPLPYAGDRAGPPLPEIATGVPDWFTQALRSAVQENAFLRANGADASARARDNLMAGLIEAANRHYDELLTTAEAAAEVGKCAETMRRAIRDGRLPQTRNGTRGQYRIRRGDALAMAASEGGSYDPQADAHDIAKRRRSS